MIPTVPDWSWELRHDGVVLAPREGKGCGHIYYTERNRPILRVRELVKDVEADARFRIVKVGKPERVVTNEGEYGAVVTVDGLLLEAPVQRTIGFVFGDDFYSRIDGIALRPEEFERFARVVQNLTKTDQHSLGFLRRRRFYYNPPVGWHGTTNFLHAYWYPLDYPRNRSSLTVVPALPMPRGLPEYLQALAELQTEPGAGFTIDQKVDAGPVATRHNLKGTRWELSGRYGGTPASRDVVILEDGQFVYVVLLESARGERDKNLRIFDAVYASIEPIPQAGESQAKESKESLQHWAE